MEANMKIAVILQAFDKISSVINPTMDNAKKKISEVAQMSKKFAEGGALMGAGYKMAKTLEPAIDAFKETQAAANELKASMMTKGGVLDEGTYKKIYGLTNDLSDKYKGSASSYLEMVTVLKNNRINEQDVLGGIGEATAKLSDFFQMAPSHIAEFASHMKNDMGVGVGEMDKMMDMIARVHNSGVGKTGEEAVTQMNEFFSKASLGAANLGVQGLEASRQLGALGSLFMSRGLSGATVGTNFRRIFDGLRDLDKVNKAKEVAKEYGITLDLFDKQGHFGGIDNFVQQLGKMQDLKPQAISSIFKAFGGKQGLSTDFLEYLGKEGLKGFTEFNKKIEEQANLDQKLKAIMDGLEYKQSVMATSWFNLKATFGATMAPVLNGFYDKLNEVTTAIRHFLEHHPRIARMAAAFVALSSAALMIGGAIKAIQGVRVAFQLLNLTMAANPVMLAVAGIIVAATLIIGYWDKIGPFFTKIWDKVKGVFSVAWRAIKAVLWDYQPSVIIYRNWGRISAFFSGIWESVKGVFLRFWEWIKAKAQFVLDLVTLPFRKANEWLSNIGGNFVAAGKNIIMSIYNGMKSVAMYPINKVKEMVGKIRNLLPFSPAKDGPLRDIHRIRLVETIAESIKPNALVNKMRGVAQMSLDIVNKPGGRLAPVSNRGNVTISPTFHFALSGSATKQDAAMFAREAEKHFGKWMKNYQSQQMRSAFG